MPRTAPLLVAVALVACADAPPAASDSGVASTPERLPAALVDSAAWVENPTADPMPEHRPADSDCAPSGWGLEGSSVEVDTGLCPFAVLAQPALADLRRGDRVEVVLWHKDLVAEEPAEAHVLITMGDVVVYEDFVAIPAEPVAYTEEVEVAGDAPAGAPIVLHLHNHGANSWNLLSIDRL
mgnify:CR=1 FL=1